MPLDEAYARERIANSPLRQLTNSRGAGDCGESKDCRTASPLQSPVNLSVSVNDKNEHLKGT